MRNTVENAKHTLLHKNCPVCSSLRKLARRSRAMGSMGLREAGQLWLIQKTWKRRKPKTIECSKGHLKALLAFFGDMPLTEFHPGSLLAYQEHRMKTVGASAINHEVNALAQMLRQAGLWAKLRDYYGPIPEPEWQKPKVFTVAEQERIFDFAKDDPALELADIVFTITRNTSASGCELRLTRIRNVNLDSNPPTFNVTGDTTKNDIRPRLIPLNQEAEDAFRRALERAYRLGSHRPDHFLFPFRVNRATYDPEKPASKSWLRFQTKTLRQRTGIQHLRPHAWRHQLCTEMLEQGQPRDTVVAVMGWVSEKMVDAYCHTRLAAKQDAINAARRKPVQSEGASSKIIVFPQK